MLNKLDYVILFVSNMKESTKFYRDILQLPMKSESEISTEFLHGETMLALHSQTEGQNLDKNPKTGVTIGFVVNNIDSLCDELKGKGVKFLEGPKDEEFGRHAVIVDPDGYAISLAQMKSQK